MLGLPSVEHLVPLVQQGDTPLRSYQRCLLSCALTERTLIRWWGRSLCLARAQRGSLRYDCAKRNNFATIVHRRAHHALVSKEITLLTDNLVPRGKTIIIFSCILANVQLLTAFVLREKALYCTCALSRLLNNINHPIFCYWFSYF